MDTDVVIAGAGPNGLMLAAELALAGVRPVVVERLAEPSTEPKANGLVGQVVRFLHHRGLYQRFSGLPAPFSVPRYMFGALPLDLTTVDNNPLHILPIPQRRLEALLAERAGELDVAIRRGHDLVELSQDADGVDLLVRGPDGDYRLRAGYLVGCDGGHSTVRKQVGVDFVGETSTDLVSRMAHVSLSDVPRTPDGGLDVPGFGAVAPGFTRTERGLFAFMELEPGRPLMSTVEWDQPCDDNTPMTVAELRASVRRVLGADVPIGPPSAPGPHALRRLVGRNTRLADRYRVGRVLLAGDAAHVQSAMGGPGLNLGLQDVANLGWKLAAQVRGTAPAGLLDSYEAERRPVGQRVVMHSQAQTALVKPGAEVTALRELFAELLRDKENTQRIADLMAGADVRYDMDPTSGQAPAHDLVGRFAPDLDLVTATGPTQLATLMHAARPVLVDLTGAGELTEVAAGWRDRVDVVAAHGPAAPVTALLVRPDGYVAWAAGATEAADTVHAGLCRALTTWFGAPATAG